MALARTSQTPIAEELIGHLQEEGRDQRPDRMGLAFRSRDPEQGHAHRQLSHGHCRAGADAVPVQKGHDDGGASLKWVLKSISFYYY